MNVVIIGHTYIAPINRKKWIVLAQLYPELNLTIIIPKTWPSTLFDHVADITDEYYLPNCHFIALDAQRTGNELLYAYRSHQLYKILKQAKPTILHVEQGYSSAVYAQANIVARMVDNRIISTFFTWVSWEQKETLRHKIFFRPLEKINLAYAQAAFVGNHDAATLLIKRKFTKPIYIIPQLGVDTDLFKPLEQIKNGRKRIGFIGRLVEEKGILTLLEAFADLAHFFPEWDLVFVGKGPAKETLVAAILHHNLHERTHIIDPVPHEQIPGILNSLAILVLPSFDTPTWREQFGHVLIEAMACGVPVIGSNAGEIPHVIGTAGLIFEQQDAKSLLAQLKTLMQDETLRHALIKEGLQLAHTTYSHQAIAQQTHDSWLKMVTKQG